MRARGSPADACRAHARKAVFEQKSLIPSPPGLVADARAADQLTLVLATFETEAASIHAGCRANYLSACFHVGRISSTIAAKIVTNWLHFPKFWIKITRLGAPGEVSALLRPFLGASAPSSPGGIGWALLMRPMRSRFGKDHER